MQAKEIRSFLETLNGEDFRYMEIQISIAKDAKGLIKNYNLTDDEFCDLLKIGKRDIKKFLNGGYNYDIRKLSLIHCAYETLESEKAKSEATKGLTDVNTK